MITQKKKEESTLASGYSGKTQAILREALRKADAGKVKPPAEFLDGEDKAPVSFFIEGPEAATTWVTMAKSAEPMVVKSAVDAKAPLTDPLPDLSKVPRDMAAVLAAIRQHQDAVTLDMVQREAGREALRRQLLEREIIAWRREQMEKAFAAERTAAHELLKRTMAHFEEAIGEYRKKFASMHAAAVRLENIMAQKKAAELADALAGVK